MREGVIIDRDDNDDFHSNDDSDQNDMIKTQRRILSTRVARRPQKKSTDFCGTCTR